MIARLFGYDFRALSRFLLPIHAVILVVVLAGMLFMGWWYHHSDPSLWIDSIDSYRFFYMIYNIALSLCAFVCIGGLASTFIVGINRFYTNLFTDEGQLTLTLPLRAAQILLSKVLAVLVWVFIDILVLILCYFLSSFGMRGFESIDGVADALAYFFGLLGDFIIGPLNAEEYPFFPYQLLGFTQVLISIMSSMLLAFLAFTLGAMMANRHRVLVGIVWYIGLSWFVFFFNSVVGFIWTPYFSLGSGFFLFDFLEDFFGASLFVNCLVIVVSFVLAAYLLTHKVDAKG